MARFGQTGALGGLLLLAALSVADGAAGSRVVLIGFFGLAPLVTAAVSSVRQTALVGGAAVVAGSASPGNVG